MARTNNLTNFLTDVASAIKTAKGDNTPIPASDFDTEISNLGGGDIVNGIIEQYNAETGTISANTFVEFVNKTTINSVGTDTQLSSTTNSYEFASAVALSDSKVLVTHRGGNYLYGVICTISGTTITAGTDTQISTKGDAYYYSSIAKLSNNKVFITLEGSGYLYGVICEISESTITVGTETKLSTTYGSYEYSKAVSLNDSKVFITYNGGGYLYGIICEISGSVITAGTEKQISSTTSSYEYSSPVVLNENKVFISHRGGSNNLYGIICNISGTTITNGTDTPINSSASSSSHSSSIKLNDSKVFVIFNLSGYLTGVICTINDVAITVGTAVQLSSTTNSHYYSSIAALNSSKVFIAHRGTNDCLYGVVCAIDDTKITVGTAVQLSSTTNSYYYTSTVALSNSKVFVAHRGSSSQLYATVCNIEKSTIKQSTSKIDGLTKTGCTTSTAGDVWVLE